MASDCRLCLEQESLCCPADEQHWARLHAHLQRLDEFPPELLQDIRTQACSLSSSRALRVWEAAWVKCEEVRRMLEERLLLLEGDQTHHGHHTDWTETATGEKKIHRRLNNFDFNCTCLSLKLKCRSYHPAVAEEERECVPESETRVSRSRDSIHNTVTCFNFRSKPRRDSKNTATVRETPADSSQKGRSSSRRAAPEQRAVSEAPVGCQWFPWQNTVNRSSSRRSELHITEPIQRHNSFSSQTHDTHGDAWRNEGENTADTPESPSRSM